MGVHAGKSAHILNVTHVRNWQINETQTNPKAVHSASLGGTQRRTGVSSWTGSFSCYGHSPQMVPGSSYSFEGYGAPINDISGSGSKYSGTIFVNQVAITWNWASGEVLAHTINFDGHLTLTINDSATVTEDTEPAIISSVCGTKITYGTGNGTNWGNLTQATFTMMNPSVAYVNSSTNCGTGRLNGPAFDWSLSVTEQNDTRITALALGNQEQFKIWIDDSNYWQLCWGRVKEYTGQQFDRETGAVIQRTVVIEMDGFDEDDGSQGCIKAPDDTDHWGNSTGL